MINDILSLFGVLFFSLSLSINFTSDFAVFMWASFISPFVRSFSLLLLLILLIVSSLASVASVWSPFSMSTICVVSVVLLVFSVDVTPVKNGFVDAAVVVIVGDIFKNGFVDDLTTWVVSFVPLFLNSALKMFIDGTLIFSIVPRFSEKCVTVTASVVTTFGTESSFSSNKISEVDLSSLFFGKPADGGGEIVGNVVVCGDFGDVSIVALEFFTTFDVPVKFNVSLSPPWMTWRNRFDKQIQNVQKETRWWMRNEQKR